MMDVMLDLETLGTGNNACILSIGAVKFDPKVTGLSEDPLDRFEIFIDPQSCVDFGLVIDPSTVMWWMHPDRDEARKVFVGRTTHSLPLALEHFSDWISGDRPVWGNGATFDNVVIRSAYRATKIRCPWHFRNDRCFRTMSNMLPRAEWERLGTHHSAVDDAATQALYLQRIINQGVAK